MTAGVGVTSSSARDRLLMQKGMSLGGTSVVDLDMVTEACEEDQTKQYRDTKVAGVKRQKLKLGNRSLPAFTIEVLLLGGDNLRMRVTASSTVEALSERVSHMKQLKYEVVHLCDDTRILDKTETLAALGRKTVTAIISKPPLSAGAVELLQRCGGTGKEEHIEMFEITNCLDSKDLPYLAELLQWYQPHRLWTGKPSHDGRRARHLTSVARVGEFLKTKLTNLKTIQLYPVHADDLPHAEKLLNCCSVLQQCDLTENSLAAVDVARLRDAVQAQIII